MARIALWIIGAALVVALMFYGLAYKHFVLDAVTWAPSARADDDSYRHARGHNHYKEWASRLTSNCCDERDCRDYADDEVRVTPTGDKELHIGGGQWCPVTPLHYVVRGKSPDATSYHACVIPNYNADPCARFKCFMDKWGG